MCSLYQPESNWENKNHARHCNRENLTEKMGESGGRVLRKHSGSTAVRPRSRHGKSRAEVGVLRTQKLGGQPPAERGLSRWGGNTALLLLEGSGAQKRKLMEQGLSSQRGALPTGDGPCTGLALGILKEAGSLNFMVMPDAGQRWRNADRSNEQTTFQSLLMPAIHKV